MSNSESYSDYSRILLTDNVSLNNQFGYPLRIGRCTADSLPNPGGDINFAGISDICVYIKWNDDYRPNTRSALACGFNEYSMMSSYSLSGDTMVGEMNYGDEDFLKFDFSAIASRGKSCGKIRKSLNDYGLMFVRSENLTGKVGALYSQDVARKFFDIQSIDIRMESLKIYLCSGTPENLTTENKNSVDIDGSYSIYDGMTNMIGTYSYSAGKVTVLDTLTINETLEGGLSPTKEAHRRKTVLECYRAVDGDWNTTHNLSDIEIPPGHKMIDNERTYLVNNNANGTPMEFDDDGTVINKKVPEALEPVFTKTVEVSVKGTSSGGSGSGGSSLVKPTPTPVAVSTASPSGTTAPSADTGLPFTDVKTSDWFYDNVKYVYENKLFSGVSDTLFAPDEPMTRTMLVTVLFRAEGEPDMSEEIWGYPFEDVDAESWYGAAVYWARNRDIVQGNSPENFAPDEPVTREQIAAILYRYAQFKGIETDEIGDLSQFTDADQISDWAQNNVGWAIGKGLLTGKGDGVLDPLGNATRAEIAAMLQRFNESSSASGNVPNEYN